MFPHLKTKSLNPCSVSVCVLFCDQVLSNTIKQKRKEKAGKWEVPLPKVSCYFYCLYVLFPSEPSLFSAE